MVWEGPMAHPYQCLLYCVRPEETISEILIAASGSYLHIFDVLNGQNLSSWTSTSGTFPVSHKNGAANAFAARKNAEEDANEDSQPSPKRRKLSPGPNISTESSSTEILVDNGDPGRDLHSNPVIKLAASSDSHYIVAVTGEDKCLRVLELSGDGTIRQISERLMPKRPCAITVSPDDSTILLGDKFGDVYALPLRGLPYESQASNCNSENGLKAKAVQSGLQQFVPSATSLTVHTKRNLNALKQQQQHIPRLEKPERRSLAFEHKLLFGHVSLLTDLTCSAVPSSSRNYILTSDRDEHIRVSRGIPQAHMIVRYCHGHTEFVSKLCLIPSKPELLVTGGGDDFLLLWDWLAGEIKQRIDISRIVQDIRRKHSGGVDLPDVTNNAQFVVTNIQPLEFDRDQAGEKQTELVVTCEGIPALFFFTLDAHDRIKFRDTYPTEGNVIDLVVMSDRNIVLCSLDNIHNCFSTSTDNCKSTSRSLIDAIHFSNSAQQWERDSLLYERLSPALEKNAKNWPMMPQNNAAKGKSLKELIYGWESLRKNKIGHDLSTETAAQEEDVA